jgi:hypothetical protein
MKVYLFGNAHQSLYKESEGSVMAICNARVSTGGEAHGLSMKVQDPSSVYKLGTSADFALCGARKKASLSFHSKHLVPTSLLLEHLGISVR